MVNPGVRNTSAVSTQFCRKTEDNYLAKLLYATGGRRCAAGSICRWLFMCAERLFTRSNTLQIQTDFFTQAAVAAITTTITTDYISFAQSEASKQ